jgi:hypothetical protein
VHKIDEIYLMAALLATAKTPAAWDLNMNFISRFEFGKAKIKKSILAL